MGFEMKEYVPKIDLESLFCSAVLYTLWRDGNFDQSNMVGIVLCSLTILLSTATIIMKIM